MKKIENIKYAFYFLAAVLIGAFIYMISTTSEFGVSGTLAMKIALQSTKYVVMSIIVILASIAGVILALKKGVDGGYIVALWLAVLVLVSITVFLRPVNIKNDFQSANITVEQIQHIKDNLKK